MSSKEALMLSSNIVAPKPVFSGQVVPAGWDDDGHVLAVALATDEQEEFLIRKSPKADLLIPLVKKRVEVLAREWPLAYGVVSVIEVEDFGLLK